jgi:hypothetical protein
VNLPGFSADASLYDTTQFYSTRASDQALELRASVDMQRVRNPEGPIGLPGQNCSGACLHVCMLSGRATKECIDQCMSTCSGSPLMFTSARL